MANLSGVKVGDVLLLVPEGKPIRRREITVQRLGKIYAYFGEGKDDRFDINSGRCVCATTGNCWATIWPSEAAYNQESERVEAWCSLRKAVQAWKPPEGVTTEAIQQARALLGLDQA
jgi:hypothetical protein